MERGNEGGKGGKKKAPTVLWVVERGRRGCRWRGGVSLVQGKDRTKFVSRFQPRRTSRVHVTAKAGQITRRSAAQTRPERPPLFLRDLVIIL